MTTATSQIVLTFLLNACWQIGLVAGLATISSWLLRNSGSRYRHYVWVTALLLSLGVPLTTSLQSVRTTLLVSDSAVATANDIGPLVPFTKNTAVPNQGETRSEAFLLSRVPGLLLIAVYLSIFLYSSFRLFKAWRLTSQFKRSAFSVSAQQALEPIVQSCAAAVQIDPNEVKLYSSKSIDVPFTVGTLRPVIILPEQLLSEANQEILKSAIGHELIHVKRRDYAFNLVYEFLFLPLSFHPAAALIRRRIRQTRELSCDEFVAERILNAEAYARSLVQLASKAPTLPRLSVTTTVGIADADILEARVMSLLRKSKLDTRRKRMVLIGLSLFLVVPCLAAASFATKFDVRAATSGEQEQATQEKQRREVGEVKTRMDETKVREMKEKMEQDPAFREEILRKQAVEVQARALKQAALAKVTRISMDQAIQIATAQKPGTVMQCNLDATHWKEMGVLADDAVVFYRVQVVGSDQVENGGITHIWVNAVDGSIVRTEQELPRKQKQPE